MVQSKFDQGRSRPAPALRPSRPERAFSADLAHRPNRRALWRLTLKPEEEDVIDLGAPRKVRIGRSLGPAPPRASRVYTPNPRLYPGPQKPASQPKQKRKPNGPRGQRKKTAFSRPVPNSRLYRPAPPRPPPPPAYPRTVWRPPTKDSLETASRVALRLSHGLWSPSSTRPSVNTLLRGPPGAITRKTRRLTLHTRKSPTCSPSRHIKPAPPPLAPTPSQAQKLVITLPAAGDGNAPTGQDLALHYQPASLHFRNRQLLSSPGDSTPTGGRVIHLSTRGAMDATPRHSTSPEDCSEGNDSHSAPSEFLAEFLSAIMRRQYAEALKYCRLILQYEPRNATARGFYPLLQQKLAQQSPRQPCDMPAARARHQRSPRVSRSPDLAGGSSGGSSGESSPVPSGILPHEVMEQEADWLSGSGPRPGSAGSSEAEPGLGSVSSQSSLELDSSEPARSSPSLSLSRRTDHTDSASASGAWDSSGSGARDDNGNPAPALTEPRPCCDAENNQPATSKLSPRRSARARPLTLQVSLAGCDAENNQPATSKLSPRRSARARPLTLQVSLAGCDAVNNQPATSKLSPRRSARARPLTLQVSLAGCDAENNQPATSKLSPRRSSRTRPLTLQVSLAGCDAENNQPATSKLSPRRSARVRPLMLQVSLAGCDAENNQPATSKLSPRRSARARPLTLQVSLAGCDAENNQPATSKLSPRRSARARPLTLQVSLAGCDAENNQPATSKLSPRRSARARPLTLQSEQSTESLRRLRAQFACSIK